MQSNIVSVWKQLFHTGKDDFVIGEEVDDVDSVTFSNHNTVSEESADEDVVDMIGSLASLEPQQKNVWVDEGVALSD